ncbi:ectonucleoside triphosphate diphosphohydrolase 1 isoform X2 [Hyperolius riggenbachi]|uniref:ectonucleoside triphosphate diphosphohydrolase 1 isoform X2 n=1 Tax=Hyperolius riggenbachi TaxID=752182 RepID=UPI0035A2944A
MSCVVKRSPHLYRLRSQSEFREIAVYSPSAFREAVVKQKTWNKKALFILGVLFVLGIAALVVIAVLQNKPLPENIKYGIVLDAGSSHTSLYIYQWPAEKENDTGVVHQVAECKVEGNGISSYHENPIRAGLSLQTCMDKALEHIPANKHKETPVYLGATAGMRLLRLSNSRVAEEVLVSVENTLRSFPFDFQGARIITGQEEGAYGWITINYLQENFRQDSPLLRFKPNSRTETSGALDLGGASTQITFVPEETIESLENSLHFRLYGKTYNVYTHSFLCYGKDQALRQQLARSMTDEQSTLLDPCFNSGYIRNFSTFDLYSSPCVSRLGLLPLTLSKTIQIQGTGNYHLCKDRVQAIFNVSHCNYSRCSFNGVYQPLLHGKFGAFSAFYFVMDFLKRATGTFSLESVKEAVEMHCAKPWNEVKRESGKIKEKYLSEYCFSGVYILNLLQLYGFNASIWDDLSFVGKIHGSDAGWTLGYMLNLTNMIPAELPPSPPLSHGGYVGLMVFFSVLSTFVLLTCWLAFRKPKCLQKGII